MLNFSPHAFDTRASYIKDEGLNPTASFKARGLSAHDCRASRRLRVPKPLGDFLILADLYASHGEAVAATDDEMLAACRDMATLEGIFAAPEGGAGLAATRKLVEQKKIQRHETVVLFNTGSGYKRLAFYASHRPHPQSVNHIAVQQVAVVEVAEPGVPVGLYGGNGPIVVRLHARKR